MSTLDVGRVVELCRARSSGVGEPLRAVAETGSTNDDAMAAVRAGAPHGATFVADAQTRGRGRRGSRWTSLPGENLLLSVVLRPKMSLERAGTFTLAVGLAVRDVVRERTERVVSVKWPNDVWVDERKIAGVLVESQVEGGALAALVVGIGLNVGMQELPAELAGVATSLALVGAERASREEVLADLLVALERRLAAHERWGLDAVLEELRAADALEGRRVRVDRYEGFACGIDDTGALLVRDDDGALRPVTAGSVLLV